MTTGVISRPGVPTTKPRSQAVTSLLWLLVAAGSAVAIAADPEPPSESLAGYLAEWELDRSRWTSLEVDGPWDAARQSLVLKLMARVGRLPADRLAAWQAAAVDVSQSLPTSARDTFVRIEGRGVFIAAQRLTAEEAAVAGRAHLDILRVATAEGRFVDVILESTPLAWSRWTAIDEPVAVVGLPLTTGPGPVPEAAGRAWPTDPHALLLLGSRLSWFPATTLLGSLGMDYATFETVADGRPLVAGDTEAFYGMLTATGRGKPGVIAAAASGITDVIPLIDPAENWFATHRGDVVTIKGIARRATRIMIDDPARRQQVGADHYWELYVFVPTPLIRVNDTLQDDFPIVCCVRSLPADMPTGDRISEQVNVSGFALKRYAYPLQRMRVISPQGDEEAGGGRRETPLIIGQDVQWTPAPSARPLSDDIGRGLAGIAVVVGLLLGAAAWAGSRSARRQERGARERLPDQIDLPPSA